MIVNSSIPFPLYIDGIQVTHRGIEFCRGGLKQEKLVNISFYPLGYYTFLAFLRGLIMVKGNGTSVLLRAWWSLSISSSLSWESATLTAFCRSCSSPVVLAVLLKLMFFSRYWCWELEFLYSSEGTHFSLKQSFPIPASRFRTTGKHGTLLGVMQLW